MDGPYRRAPDRAPVAPRRDDLLWRKRVSRGAAWVLAILVMRWVVPGIVAAATVSVVVSSKSTPEDVSNLAAQARLMRDARVATGAVLALALVVATWRFTLERPTAVTRFFQLSRRGLMGVVVLASALELLVAWTHVASPLLEGALYLLATSWPALAISALPAILGFVHVGGLFSQIDEPRQAWAAFVGAGAYSAGTGMLTADSVLASEDYGVVEAEVTSLEVGGTLLYLMAVIGAFVLLRRLHRYLRVVEHQWWLETAALPKREWASLAAYGNGVVDVLTADGDRYEFDEWDDAVDWLVDEEFVAEEQARTHDPGAVAPSLGSALPAAP